MKTKSRFFKVAVLIAIFFGSAFISYSFVSEMKGHSSTTNEIAEILTEYCNCEKVVLDTSSFGLAFSNNGIAHTTASYRLMGTSNASVEAETIRLHTLLKSNVATYHKMDSIELTYVSEAKEESIVLKNGKIK